MRVSLLPFKKENFDEIKGWDGFIDPNGLFYKVCERGEFVSEHDNFAECYVDMVLHEDIRKKYENFRKARKEYVNINLAPKDILVNLYGFVNYEASHGKLEITTPDKKFCGKELTDKQIESIAKLIYVNGDSLDDLAQVFNDKIIL